jgi:hypothetical protein
MYHQFAACAALQHSQARGTCESAFCLTSWNVLVLVCNRTFHARHRISAGPASQDMVKPAVLRNRGNEYLHYEDDWYILAFKPDKYALIYYKGNNDAWQGYGGATVYTKCAAAHAPSPCCRRQCCVCHAVPAGWQRASRGPAVCSGTRLRAADGE